MQCSDCSARIKPLVAVDIDGTLGDYHTHFLKFASSYLNVSADFLLNEDMTYDGSIDFRDWFEHMTHKPPSVFREVKLAYRQGGMKRSMPELVGAGLMMDSIKRAGAEVMLTTTRPYLRLDNVDPDTREWLRRTGIAYDGLLYDEDKYKVLASNVDPRRVVAVVDDLAEQVVAAQQVFNPIVPLCVGTVYNRNSKAIKLPSLLEAGAIILERINDWKDHNDR